MQQVEYKGFTILVDYDDGCVWLNLKGLGYESKRVGSIGRAKDLIDEHIKS